MTTSPTPSPQTATAAESAADAAAGVAAALGRIPSGLFVVTWRESGQDRAMLASWVMQAGFEPPMLTVAVAPARGLHAAVAAGTPFVVNVLAEHQRPLLARFGKPAAAGDDPFAGLAVKRVACGAAALVEAAGWLECTPVARESGSAAVSGDHVVVLARVTAADAGGERAPLVHLRKNGLRY
jgi:flavin reductase (DIM6/NTAB) family NADH-FMN oxidoreductase RutF